ncbi:DUF3293 domain-containing protein [Actinomycetospora sp. NBRC 106378]|uniref:DUF3293 domain-containing protein n=1 Tax=Actinomycetospora sp. NBRC 106378 TaxID=3032208 RepID=UPI00249FA331|nr:DUF3293 domain-containing protein [Actinomycetospora sp. NBRC 106378]GLZ53935.1 hypothetical protein Acsp07_35520 [Actinomycetospora sp. NBRC 106378]
MTDREERFAGYRRARLRVPDLHGRTVEVHPAPPGTTTGRFPFAGPVHVLTAFDPGPARFSPAENARRQQALVHELPAHVRRWDAEAGAADGSHTERSVLVEGLTDDEARALGARHGQDAIFRWSAAAWSIVPCDAGPAVDAGWTLSG